MQKPLTTPEPVHPVLDAIYKRQSIRSYTAQPLSPEVIKDLMKAAVQAPTAVNEQPWAFVVIESKDVLKRISDAAKETMDDVERSIHVPGRRMLAHFMPPDDFFHGAPVLIVIYGKSMGPFVAADCWLAAENLILAACAMDLGTCAIGLVVSVLNRSEWKREFGVPEEMTAIAPIVVGFPDGATKRIARKEPQVLLWK